MNNTDFENQLRALRPVAPSDALERRIAAELSTPSSGLVKRGRESWFGWLFPRLGWATAGAVVALGITAITRTEPAAITAPPASAPAVVEQRSAEILNANDEGLTVDRDQGVARLVRLSSIERRAWVDATGAEMIVEVPREELVLVPVAYQ